MPYLLALVESYITNGAQHLVRMIIETGLSWKMFCGLLLHKVHEGRTDTFREQIESVIKTNKKCSVLYNSSEDIP